MTDARRTFHAAETYLGYRAADEAKPFARFLSPASAPLPADVIAAAARPVDAREIAPFADCVASLSSGDRIPCETGWTMLDDGVAVVAVHTPMPRVNAAMWDWWFGWHGNDAARYKLWCPEAHLLAQWADGDGERAGSRSYVGRTSFIKEYIGEFYLEGAIRFVPPADLGFAPFDGTVICGRAGEVDAPVEHTWLIHHVHNTPEGCEMRSRFYLGQDPRLTTTGERPPALGDKAAKPNPGDLLLHCATEMRHLAGFLPELHAAFGR